MSVEITVIGEGFVPLDARAPGSVRFDGRLVVANER